MSQILPTLLLILGVPLVLLVPMGVTKKDWPSRRGLIELCAWSLIVGVLMATPAYIFSATAPGILAFTILISFTAVSVLWGLIWVTNLDMARREAARIIQGAMMALGLPQKAKESGDVITVMETRFGALTALPVKAWNRVSAKFKKKKTEKE